MAAPFFIHWYVIGDVPVAATLNVAVWPAVTVSLAGCVVIAGATVAVFTDRIAALLVALPALLLTVTANVALLSEVTSAAVV